MDLKQVVQVVKMSIDHKTQDLRDQVIKKLDVAMAAKIEGAGRKAPTLEPERLLAISVEEYHHSRGLADHVAATSGARVQLPKFEDLPPEVKKEISEISSRLTAALIKAGEKNVDAKQVRDWSLQCTVTRRNLVAASPNLKSVADWVEKKLAEGASPKKAILEPDDAVTQLSPEEFQANLEENVRQMLLNATADQIDDVIANLPNKVFKEDEATMSALKGGLLSEFAPIADKLMEAIVQKDFQKWIEALGMREGTKKQNNMFTKMTIDFKRVLEADISVQTVQGICRAVVDPDEFYDLIMEKAKKLSRTGVSARRLGESSSSDEDDDLKGTAQFGKDAF